MNSKVNINSISLKVSAQCGYCQGTKQNKLWVTSSFCCNQMILEDYQDLIDQGWRRCGRLFYFPHADESCCQAYTIRLDVNKYQIRSSHEKILRKIKNICQVQEDKEMKQQTQEVPIVQREEIMKFMKQKMEQGVISNKFEGFLEAIKIDQPFHAFGLRNIEIGNEQIYQEEAKQFINELFVQLDKHKNQFIVDEIQQQQFKQILDKISNNYHLFQNNRGYTTTNILGILYVRFNNMINSQKKSKLFQISKFKMKEIYEEIVNITNQKLNNNFITKIYPNLSLAIQSEYGQECKQVKSLIYSFIYLQQKQQKKKQKVQVADKVNKNKLNKQSPITIQWVPAQFQVDSYQLYCKYQHQIHKKQKATIESYKSFLCQSILMSKDNQDNEEKPQGSWHMKYYLENRLIAVGVVDILPNSLSSVYFFYDPDYRKFSLGVYGALKEIEYIKKMKEKYTNFKNYYLGYYIQDSQKMLYKGEYKISELLCPITKNWVELNDDLRKKINEGIKKLSESEKNIKSEEEVSLYIESYVKIRQGNRQYDLQQLKACYARYLINLFSKLYEILGEDLLKNLVFSYI